MRLALVVASILFEISTAQGPVDIRIVLLKPEAYRHEVLCRDIATFTPLVTDALNDRKPLVRRNAAIALGVMDLYVEESMLKSIYLNQPIRDEEVDKAQYPNADVVAALLTAARDSDRGTRDAAIRSLIVLLRNREWGLHGEPWGDLSATNSIVQLGPSVIGPLISELHIDGETRERRRQRFGVKVAAIQVLSKFRDTRILNEFLRLIERENGAVVVRAMQSVVEYDDRRVANVIVANVSKGIAEYSFVGLDALRSLGERALPAIIKGLSKERGELPRMLLMEALGEHSDSSARRALIALLRDRDQYIARYAAEILVKYPGADTAAALTKAARSSSELLAAEVVRSLGKFKP